MSSGKNDSHYRRGQKEIDDDPRDLEEREEYRAALEAEEQQARRSGAPRPQSLLERIGLTPLLAAAAAILAIAVALYNTFSAHHGIAPDMSHATAGPANSADPSNPSDPSIFTISDYWHGTASSTSEQLIFHLLVAETATLSAVSDRPAAVMGTMRLPCQGSGSTRIDSGTWDGSHLVLRVADTGSGKPLSVDVRRNGDRLEGSITQGSYKGQLTLDRGEIACASH